VRLAPRDVDKLLLHNAGFVAQKRLARGLRLNYPEAVALIATQLLELIRDGRRVAELMDIGRTILGRYQVMDGVPELIPVLAGTLHLPVAAVVAGLQAVAAIKLLSGNAPAVGHQMIVLDLWANRLRAVSTREAKDPDCPACGRRTFEFLEHGAADRSVSLCGRNAVQVRPSVVGASLDLAALARRLGHVGLVEQTPYLVRCDLGPADDLKMTVFPDGRMIVQGTADLARARSVYARYVGT